MSYDFSAIFNDPRMYQEYTYIRNIGDYSEETGEWEGKPTTGTFKGIIKAAPNEALQYMPEGETINGVLEVTSDTELLISSGNHLSDEFTYRNHKYKITAEIPLNWNCFQYLATRIKA